MQAGEFKFKQHLFIATAIVIVMMLYSGCSNDSIGNRIPEDKKLNLANSYYNNELYEAAVAEYLDYLENYSIDANKQANTYYMVANIYFERLHDYQKSLEYYFRIKYLYPESSLQNEVGKRIVNCLERLERSRDAQRILEKETALKPDEINEQHPGEIIAEIGDRKITQGDIDFELNQLPDYFREQFNSKEKRLEFLKQFIIEELLYDSAKRQELNKDKEIVEGTFRAQKRLMAQKLLTAEIQKEMNITDADIELYYKANHEKYAEKDDKGKVIRQKSLQEAAQQVANDLAREKQGKIYNQLIERLMQAQHVKIFENKVR